MRKKVSSAKRKETWARVSTAPTHSATTAPDLDRLQRTASGDSIQLSLQFDYFVQSIGTDYILNGKFI